MKFNLLKYIFGLGVMFSLFSACDDGDSVVDMVTDNVNRGAVLRQIAVPSNSVAINSATNVLEQGESFDIVLEFQGSDNGAMLESINVFLSFVDNTDEDPDDDIDNTVDNSVDEIFVENIPASEFMTGERNLPVLNYNISAQEMQSLMGLEDDQLGLGGDTFVLRYELLLQDGRSFTNANNSGTITGSFFNSPFQNFVPIVCSPSVPTAGTWLVNTVDSFGDGWNGGFLTVVLDGVETETIENAGPFPSPNMQDFEFEVPEGTQTISIQFTAGGFVEEVSWVITSANGNVVSEEGPSPPAGSELLDYCPDNL